MPEAELPSLSSALPSGPMVRMEDHKIARASASTVPTNPRAPARLRTSPFIGQHLFRSYCHAELAISADPMTGSLPEPLHRAGVRGCDLQLLALGLT